ncbi:MAG: uracil-DNA glycosylase [Candidatus Heimdallarchaeaceae archaeon]
MTVNILINPFFLLNLMKISNDLEDLTNKIKICKLCSLYKTRKNVVPGIYGSNNELCFIGEAPGYNEDKEGYPFVGKSGKLLDAMLSEIGLERKEVSILNVVKCRPVTEDGKNRIPSQTEINICSSTWLKHQLEYLQPKLIVTLGSVALKYFFPKAKVTKEVGLFKTTNEGFTVFSTFHPAYILRNNSAFMRETYRNHFKQIYFYIKSNNVLKKPPIDKVLSSTNVKQSRLDNFFS